MTGKPLKKKQKADGHTRADARRGPYELHVFGDREEIVYQDVMPGKVLIG